MSTGFEDLQVWQKARSLAVLIYRGSLDGPLAKDFGLRDQMRRAAVSIASNIAEGYDRESAQDTIRFLFIAKASAAELLTQIHIASDIGYLNESDSRLWLESTSEISRMLRGLIRSRQEHL